MFGTNKKTLELNREQYGVILHSLKDKRNQLLEEDIPTDEVDEVLMKVIAAIEEPDRKVNRCYETR